MQDQFQIFVIDPYLVEKFKSYKFHRVTDSGIRLSL